MKNLTIGQITFESKDIWSPKPGMNIVNKSGIQRIADTFGIFPKINKVELIGNQYVVVAEAAYNGSVIQMIGTASDNNLANEIAKAFPIDMAYKRAIGKLCCEVLRREAGITDLFYSSDEMDGLNQDMPENKSAPKRKRRTAPAIENVEEVTVETPVEEPAPVVEPVAEPEVVAAIESSEEAIAEEPVTETEEIVEEVTEEHAAEDVAAEEAPVEEPVEVEVVTEEVTIEEPVEVEENPAEEVVVVEEVSETPVEVVEAEEVPAEDPESFWNERIELKSTCGTVREIFENRPDIAKVWAIAEKNNNPKYQRVTNLMRQAFKASGREDELN